MSYALVHGTELYALEIVEHTDSRDPDLDDVGELMGHVRMIVIFGKPNGDAVGKLGTGTSTWYSLRTTGLH